MIAPLSASAPILQLFVRIFHVLNRGLSGLASFAITSEAVFPTVERSSESEVVSVDRRLLPRCCAWFVHRMTYEHPGRFGSLGEAPVFPMSTDAEPIGSWWVMPASGGMLAGPR